MASRRRIHLWRDALWDSDANAIEKAVGHALSRWMDTDTLETWVGWEKIARRAGCSVSSVKRAIHGDRRRPDLARGLIALGLLMIAEHGGRFRGDSNLYRGLIPARKKSPGNAEGVPTELECGSQGPYNSALTSAVTSPDAEWEGDDIPF